MTEAEAAAAAAADAAAVHALTQAVTKSAGYSAGGGHGVEGISQLLQMQQRALLWASVQRALDAEAAEAEAGNADALHAVVRKMVASCSSEAEGSQELGAMLLSLYLKAVQAGSTKGTGNLSAMVGTSDTSLPVPCLDRTPHHEGGAAPSKGQKLAARLLGRCPNAMYIAGPRAALQMCHACEAALMAEPISEADSMAEWQHRPNNREAAPCMPS